MKKTLLVLFTIIASLGYSQDTISVLWLGNSYTGANNLSLLTRNVANSVGNEINYDTYTPGGYRFLSHTADATTFNKIASQSWDFVTLQAQSQEPSWPAGQVQNEVFPHAKELCDSIRSNNGCTKPVFYMTWGRENGDAGNCAGWPYVCTYEGMDSILNQNYKFMGKDNKALISPVGAVWNYIRNNYPTIDLYSTDGSHPSQTGSYVAALTFHTIFFQSNPESIPYNYTVDSLVADTIKNAVRLVVYDSLSKWNIGKYDGVNESIFAGCDSVIYSSNVFFMDTIFIDTLLGQNEFGCDSFIVATIKVGKENYTVIDTTVFEYFDFNGSSIGISGSYMDTLTNTSGCDSIITLNLIVVELGIKNHLNNINIYPNPVEDILIIESEESLLSITFYSVDGKEIKSFNLLDNNKIRISDMKKGMHYYKINSVSGNFFRDKLIIK